MTPKTTWDYPKLCASALLVGVVSLSIPKSRISFLVAACSATLAKLRATALCFIAVRGLWFDGSMVDAI